MARLRVTIDETGILACTVLVEIGGAMIEERLEGAGYIEMKANSTGSLLTVTLLPQMVEIVTRQPDLASEIEDAVAHGHPGQH